LALIAGGMLRVCGERHVFGVTAILPVAALAADLFVAPDGRDSNAGTKTALLATVQKAQKAVRKLATRGKEPVTVWLQPGTYYAGKSLVFGPEDSGTQVALVTWQAVNGEAIYGSQPWLVYGESQIKVKSGNYDEVYKFNAREIRFTTQGATLYAFALGWPEDGKILIRSLGKPAGSNVNNLSNVSLLGYDGRNSPIGATEMTAPFGGLCLPRRTNIACARPRRLRRRASLSSGSGNGNWLVTRPRPRVGSSMGRSTWERWRSRRREKWM
jgi:hypothetical protein